MRPALLLLPLLVACQACSPPPSATASTNATPFSDVKTARPDLPPSTTPVLPAPATATVVEAMETEPTPLHVGQILRIAVQGNASTGFVWEVAQPLPRQLVLETSDSLPQPPAPDSDRPVVGAPHPQWIYLRAVAPGDAAVDLHWRRPWEKNQPPARSLRYTVSVR